MNASRTESDSMGLIEVPAGAYYGAQTQRAVENFTVSWWRFSPGFISAIALIKWASALANEELGLLEPELAEAVRQAAEETIEGRYADHFPLDVFQTGSATSTNMNVNEVIANRANQLLGNDLGTKHPVHPNDHVNLCQSSNDVIPSATHLAALLSLRETLLPGLARLSEALKTKAAQFEDIVKSGRTHLMDATPVTLGQEFSGYHTQVEHAIRAVEATLPHLCELALGGTAVGTGINAHPSFAGRAISHIATRTGLLLKEASNHFEAQSARDAVVAASGALKSAAVAVARIANDLRWLASGPASGLGEIKLPELQPGSSIMPGKINPVIPEAVIQVAAQVIGNDTTITLAGLGGIFELNTMMPVMAYDLLFNIDTLGKAADLLAARCVEGIEADAKRCAELLEGSLVLVTSLVPAIGYDRAAAVAKEAHTTGKTLREVAAGRGLLTDQQLSTLLDPASMTRGGLNAGSSSQGGT
ncbi:MAG: class II fumarate hydratase [Actinomycetota bacterium]